MHRFAPMADQLGDATPLPGKGWAAAAHKANEAAHHHAETGDHARAAKARAHAIARARRYFGQDCGDELYADLEGAAVDFGAYNRVMAALPTGRDFGPAPEITDLCGYLPVPTLDAALQPGTGRHSPAAVLMQAVTRREAAAVAARDDGRMGDARLLREEAMGVMAALHLLTGMDGAPAPVDAVTYRQGLRRVRADWPTTLRTDFHDGPYRHGAGVASVTYRLARMTLDTPDHMWDRRCGLIAACHHLIPALGGAVPEVMEDHHGALVLLRSWVADSDEYWQPTTTREWYRRLTGLALARPDLTRVTRLRALALARMHAEGASAHQLTLMLGIDPGRLARVLTWGTHRLPWDVYEDPARGVSAGL